jgi:Spy/CpxP family protein refolding chaperone
MKKTMALIGLVSAMALTAATAFAWGPGMGRGYGSGYGPGVAASNLSAEQVAKIQKIRGERYAEMAPVRNELVTKRTELRNLFREPVLDQAKIAALQAQMQENGLAARTAMAEVLTPEQRAQLPAFGQGAGPGFGPRFGPGRGFGPGTGFGPRW